MKHITERVVEDLLRQPRWSKRLSIRSTVIPDGAMKGKVMIELIPKLDFQLLELPTELRKRVYAFVFADLRDIEISTYHVKGIDSTRRPTDYVKIVRGPNFREPQTHKGQEWNAATGKWKNGPQNELSLLQVNKQIHAEATPVAYRSVRFEFNSFVGARLERFTQTIGPSAKFLGDLALGDLTLKQFKTVLKALKDATGLRRLILDPNRLILIYIRKKAKDRHDPDSWACAFNKVVSNFLIDLKKAYATQNRSWKAADVIKFRAPPDLAPKAQLAQFEATFREIATGYLED